MGKRGKIVAAAVLAGVLALGLGGCGAEWSGTDVYEVATELGYDGSAGQWLAQTEGVSTEARRMYEEARADGYTGGYVDFLGEIGYGVRERETAVNRALRSAVDVVSTFDYAPGYATTSAKSFRSLGSGVIYRLDKAAGDAYIVTNYHVVYNLKSKGNETRSHISDNIAIMLYGSESAQISASYVGGTADYDIAVLRVEHCEAIQKSDSVTAVTAADSDAATVGERVYAVGNADGNGLSATEGVVSVACEYLTLQNALGKTVTIPEIRTDAALNHGNSGGGLFNAEGELLGIVNARSEKSGVVGVGYAIPSNFALSIAQNIIDNEGSGGAYRAMLGVTVKRSDSRAVYDENSGKTYVMETITVSDVTFGSLAYGKIETGDILYSVTLPGEREKIITGKAILENLLFNVRKGDEITVKIFRGDALSSVSFSFSSDGDFKLFA